MVIARLVVASVASKGWSIYHMNVHNAFLNGDLVEKVYIKIPYSLARQGETYKVRKLHKSLYGLKQALR